MPSFPFQNFATIFAPSKVEGTQVWTFPMKESDYITSYDAKDTGAVVLDILKNPCEYIGKKVRLAAEHMHPQNYIIKLSLIAKLSARVELVAPEEYHGDPKVLEMCRFLGEYGIFGSSPTLISGMRTWEEYIKSKILSA